MSYERRMDELSRSQSLELLGTTPVGRIVFTDRALPAIRPVNHLVDGASIILRVAKDAAITAAAASCRGVVVAYEADAIDLIRQVGWSVIVIGTARVLHDQAAADRYRSLLECWVPSSDDEIIIVSTEIVNGFKLVPSDLRVCVEQTTEHTEG